MIKLNKSQTKDSLKLLGLLLFILGCFAYILKAEIAQSILSYPFSQQYKSDTKQFKILLVWGRGIGEQEHMQRFKIAAERIGITLKPVSDMTPENNYSKYLKNRSIIAAKAFKPDLVFVLERNINPIPGYKNYAWLDQSPEMSLQWNYSKFDALLPIFDDVSLLPKHFKTYFNWYPTSYKTDYIAQMPQALFYPGGVSNDNTRGSDKYTQLFKFLDQAKYFNVYGNPERWRYISSSYKGQLPFDGVSILNVANRAGVSLVLHARDHLQNGLPTGRIFEAAAANTVIISDKNKFVLDNFGDNVLYIDVDQDAQAIFAQIDSHMRWILANPELAKQMATNCHAIVSERFNFEDQLQRLVELHKSLTG